jgi:hypothetical protein
MTDAAHEQYKPQEAPLAPPQLAWQPSATDYHSFGTGALDQKTQANNALIGTGVLTDLQFDFGNMPVLAQVEANKLQQGYVATAPNLDAIDPSQLSPDAQFGGAAGNWVRYFSRAGWHTLDALVHPSKTVQTIFGGLENAAHYYSENSLQATFNDISLLSHDARNVLWNIPCDLQKTTPEQQSKASAEVTFNAAAFFLCGAKVPLSERAAKMLGLEQKTEAELRMLGIEKRAETLEKDIVSSINRQASTGEKIGQLQALSVENEPLVENFLKRIDMEFGTKSKIDFKEPAEIETKATRDSIKEVKPWFDIEHVRDAFRFKTPVDNLNELPKIVEALKDSGFEVVKLDLDKLLTPKGRGWRMAAIDLRAPNGQIIEYQILPQEMNEASKIEHGTYQQWRNEDVTKMTNEERILSQKARLAANELYESAWTAYLNRTGQTKEDIIQIIDETRAILKQP